MADIYNKINNVIVQLSLPFSLFFNFFIFIFAVSKSTVSTRQQLASVAGFLSLTMESHTIPVPQLITTDCGVHLIPLTKEIGEIVVSIYYCSIRLFFNLLSVVRNLRVNVFQSRIPSSII